ncbi:MAG: LacI family DNA-binding transcriptional regulator [Thalassotalea sp.]
MVTLKDVAKIAGVCAATVSRVVCGKIPINQVLTRGL